MEFIMKQPENFGKLLIHSDRQSLNHPMLSFILGQAGIYVDRVKSLGGNLALANIMFEDDQSLDNFLYQNTPGYSFWRVFKSFSYPELGVPVDKDGKPVSPIPMGFYAHVAANLLGILKPGTVVRVSGHDGEVRDTLYKKLVELNEKGKHGVSFDYDAYDVHVVSRRVRRVCKGTPSGRTYVVVHMEKPITPFIQKKAEAN